MVEFIQPPVNPTGRCCIVRAWYREGTRMLLLALFLLALVPAAAAAAAAPKVDGEFKVSAIEADQQDRRRPRREHVGDALRRNPDHDVARINPKTGEVKEYDLGLLNGVSGIATGPPVPTRKLWVVESGGVTSFDPANPEGTKQTTPIAAIAGNYSIVAGPGEDNTLWVATNEALVRIPPGNPTAFSVFDEITGLNPRDIDAAAGMLLIADFAGEQILATTPQKAVNKEFTKYPLGKSTQGVAGAPNGQIAFSAPAEPEAFGLITPPGNPVFIPAPASDPFGVAFGPDGAFWVAHAFGAGAQPPGSLTRLTLDGKTTSITGFAAKAEPRQIAAGPATRCGSRCRRTKKATTRSPDQRGRKTGSRNHHPGTIRLKDDLPCLACGTDTNFASPK